MDANRMIAGGLAELVADDRPRLHVSAVRLTADGVPMLLSPLRDGCLKDWIARRGAFADAPPLSAHREAVLGDIAEALEFLHIRMHCVHADLKPENVLACARTGRTWVADFGAVHPRDTTYVQSGTTITYASEAYCRDNVALCLAHGPDGDYVRGSDPSDDVCAVGMIAYTLVTGEDLIPCAALMQAPEEEHYAIALAEWRKLRAPRVGKKRPKKRREPVKRRRGSSCGGDGKPGGKPGGGKPGGSRMDRHVTALRTASALVARVFELCVVCEDRPKDARQLRLRLEGGGPRRATTTAG